MTEGEAMVRALELARHGWGRVAPNPMVGAVLLRDGAVIAEGYHAEFGAPHAEVIALRAAEDPRGATCVVTLEPCAHHGKTPPCADALIAAGVSRVVFALPDPHGEAGGGAARLREAGIEVGSGNERERAAALNAPFLFAQREQRRPFVAVKVATSIDGFLADHRGRSQWISGPTAREWVHWLRAGFDAIGVGGRTVGTDDPSLTVRGSVVPRRAPARVVFAGRSVPADDRALVRTARDVPTIVLVAPEAAAPAEALRGAGVDVRVAGGLEESLASLRSGGLESLLIEGGGALVTALLTAGLVDRLYWVQAPIWLREGVPAFGTGPAVGIGAAAPWTVVERTALGADTLLVLDRKPCLPES